MTSEKLQASERERERWSVKNERNSHLQVPGPSMAPTSGNLSRRRGSDRSLSGSAHELAVSACMKDGSNKVPHSHSQSNLSDTPYRLEQAYSFDIFPVIMTIRSGFYTPFSVQLSFILFVFFDVSR